MKFFRRVVPSTLISIVLLLSLNLNTFASSYSYNLTDSILTVYAHNTESDTGRYFNYRYAPVGDFSDCFSFIPINNHDLFSSDFTVLSGLSNYVPLPIDILELHFFTSVELISNQSYDFDFSFICYSSPEFTCNYEVLIQYTPTVDDKPTFVDTLSSGTLTSTSNVVNISTSFIPHAFEYGVTYHFRINFDVDSSFTVPLKWLFSDFSLKMYNPVDDAFGSVIYPSTSEQIDDLNNQYEDVMNELPSVSTDDVEGVLDYDFSEFNNGLNFVRELFERTMNTFNFNLVLAFALCIGFVTYVLGRKVG